MNSDIVLYFMFRIICLHSHYSYCLAQDQCAPSTYTEIHGNLLRGNKRNDVGEEGCSRRHELKGQSNTMKNIDHADVTRSDVAEVQFLSPSDPPRVKSASSDARAARGQVSSQQTRELRKETETLLRNWTGSNRRFQITKSDSRPTPYHTDTPATSQFYSNSSSSRKPSTLQDNIPSRIASQTLESNIRRTSSTTSTSSSKENKAADIKPSSKLFQGNQSERRFSEDSADVDGRALKRRDSKTPCGSIIELADDDSYEAHYDRMVSSGGKAAAGVGLGKASGQSDAGKKQHPRGRNSDSFLAASVEPDFIRDNIHKNSDSEKLAKKNIENNEVKEVEKNILRHLSGRLGNLRHSLNKLDVSRSGVVNFKEFQSAMMQRGVNIPSSDLKRVFDDFAEDKRGAGWTNKNEVTTNDTRYSQGRAINVEQFTEHLALRNAERSAEHQRAMKKVLHASSKHEDPMLLFKQMFQDDRDREFLNSQFQNPVQGPSKNKNNQGENFYFLFLVRIKWNDRDNGCSMSNMK